MFYNTCYHEKNNDLYDKQRWIQWYDHNLLVIFVSGVLLSGKTGFGGRNNEARAFRRASRALHCSSDNKPNKRHKFDFYL